MVEHVCKQCGSCCKYLEFIFNYDPVKIEFYKARGLVVHEYDDHIVVNVPHICDKLRSDGVKWFCSIHKTKPIACKQWPEFVDGYPEPCIYGKGN